MCDKPGSCFCYTLAQVTLGAKAEIAFGAANIEASARLAIGFGCIPTDGAAKPDFRRDHLSQFSDGNLLPRA
jgi:hypothetical protein